MDKPKAKLRPWDKPKTSELSAPMSGRTRNPFYHTSRWKKESKAFRDQHPLCSRCMEEGIIAPTEVTDHKIPVGICPDPWDQNNWDGLCKKHNITKGIEDKKKYFRK
jgi:5-methylcytosine-specific restriction protein A